MNLRPLLLALTVAVAGCASTPASRIDKNPAVFDAWPQAVQARIRAGQVAIGFTTAQARMALGEPDHVLMRVTETGNEEVWSYVSHRPRISLGLGVGGGGGGTFVGGGTTLTSGGRYPDEVLRVIFSGGLVTAVEQMK